MEEEKKEPKVSLSDELLEQYNEEVLSQSTVKAGEKILETNMLAKGPATDTVKAMLSQALGSGIMPKQVLKFSDQTMEAIYGQAYNLYNQGKYKDASYIFRLLMMLDYLNSKYSLGLAACLHRMKDYKQAANVYLMCGMLDPKNPIPHYHAADCYIQLNAPLLAVFALDMCINAAKDQPQYDTIKQRAELMKEALDKQVLNTKGPEIKEEKQTAPKKKKGE